MHPQRISRTIFAIALALIFGNLSVVPSIASEPSQPAPMGLWVSAYGDGDYGALIVTTNYESNTVTILKLSDTTTVESKYVLPTGRGPIAVTVDPSGAIYTANYIDDSVTRYFWNEDLPEPAYESRTAQTGDGPNAIAVRELDGAVMIVTSNYGDNTLSIFFAAERLFTPFENPTILTDSKPMAINILSAGDWHKFYWANYESNTVQISNETGEETGNFALVEYLTWCDVRDGELMNDECDQFVVPINIVGLFVDPMIGLDAIVIFEENSPGQTTKQHFWTIAVDNSAAPLYLGEFIAPSTSYLTNQRIAVKNSAMYFLSSDGSNDNIVKYSGGTSTVIWEDSDFAAVALSMGDLYVAKASNNTVYRFDSNDELLASYSMAPTPLIAGPNFSLSSEAETVTAGTPILGYTIDSSAGGAIDSFSISPAVSNGLTFDSATGLISGTPISAAPTVNYQIIATNARAAVALPFSLTVIAASSPPVNNNQQTTISVPDPIQMSSIDSLTALNTQNETSSVVTVYGKFVETVLNIQVDGINIPRSSWSQTSTTLTFTVNKTKEAKFTFTVFNGAAPVLPVQSAAITAAAVTPPTVIKVETPTGKVTEPAGSVPATQNPSAVKAPAKIVAIKCVRGKSVKTVNAVKPKCPKGYVKK